MMMATPGAICLVPEDASDPGEHAGTASSPSCKSGRWTKDEDDRLRHAVEGEGPKNWKRISEEFFRGTRSDVQCLHRWQKVLKPGLKKGQWTADEDAIVRTTVEALGGPDEARGGQILPLSTRRCPLVAVAVVRRHCSSALAAVWSPGFQRTAPAECRWCPTGGARRAHAPEGRARATRAVDSERRGAGVRVTAPPLAASDRGRVGLLRVCLAERGLLCLSFGVDSARQVKWSQVAAQLPGRLGKQVRERWQNHLDPSLVKTPWTDAEDSLLYSLQALLGNRWSEIARAFAGRSENSVKVRLTSATVAHSRQTLIHHLASDCSTFRCSLSASHRHRER